MPESENSSTAVTTEQVQEIVNTVVSGLAARQQKEFTKMLNPILEQVSGFASKFEGLQPAPVSENNGTATPDPKIALMERELKELKAGREADQNKAARLEKENVLNKALGSYQFANDVSRETAFKTLANDVQVTSDGQYVIGDEPLDVAVKGRMAHLSGLLAPKNIGGSGASKAQQAASMGLDQLIKPQMTKDEISKAYELLKQRGS